jgi:chaperonin cofactor prefoldin
MSVESSIDDTAASIVSALSSHDLSDEEKEQVAKLVGQLLVKTVEKTTDNHLKAAANCCGSEIDLAHQIREEINRKKNVLISNLKALR